MKKINKKINIALISMIIRMSLVQNIAYPEDISALRIPIVTKYGPGRLEEIKQDAEEGSGQWFAGTWWRPIAFEYLYYQPELFPVYYQRLRQEIPEDTEVFEGKHKIVLHATRNLSPNLIMPIKDTLLEHADRVYHDSITYKVLNTCNMATINGEPFMLVTLGRKAPDRLGWWQELQSEELKRVREILLLVDPEKMLLYQN